jgi:hypothetical protein
MDSRIKELATKFHNTDIKLLHDQLADPALQNSFDRGAMMKLSEWEGLVSPFELYHLYWLTHSNRTQTATGLFATRKVISSSRKMIADSGLTCYRVLHPEEKEY